MKKHKNEQAKSNGNIRNLINFLKIFALIGPLVIYLIIITCVFPAPNSGLVCLGVLGSFSIGLGLVNFTALLEQKYLGHIVTVITVLPGVFLILISSLLMYIPPIYSTINEQHVTFYFVIWSLLLASVIYYPGFRNAISEHLRLQGMSKTRIKEGLKGFRSYWWYEQFKMDISDKWVYYVNKIYTYLFPVTVLMHLLLGWVKYVSPVTTIFLCLLFALNICMNCLICSTREQIKKEYKKYSVFSALVGYIFPVVGSIGIVSYLIQIW